MEKPLKIKFNNTDTGITNPITIGIIQTKKQIIFLTFDVVLASIIFWPLLFSWNLWFLLARYSIVIKTTTNINKTDEICEAPDKLFIPSHTLKTPKVNVSSAKYSTVPKSDTVSINTRAKPAMIPGRASGKATLKKLLLPYIKLVWKKDIGTVRNDALVVI